MNTDSNWSMVTAKCQKLKKDLERVPLDRKALRRSLDEIRNAVALEQPLLDDSVFTTVAEDVLKDIVTNTIHELSSIPSLSQKISLRVSTDGDFVSELSGGNALCATVFGMKKTNPFSKAPIPFLNKPETVKMLRPMMSLRETKFSFIDRQSSSLFLESVQSFGYSVAVNLDFFNKFSSSASYSSDSTTKHCSGQKSNTEKIYLYKVGFYPIGAFRLPLDSLEMSKEAHSALLDVTSEHEAEIYLTSFGSHISADVHHYGGLMIYHTEIQRKVDGHVSEDIATAEQKFEASIGRGFWKIQAKAAGGFHNSNSNYALSEGSKEKMSFSAHLDTYGPSTSNPSLFQEILKRDRTTNYLIDKGNFKVLRPVWEIARRTKDPKIEKASKMLLEVWLKKTQHTSNTMIAELREQYREQLMVDTRGKLLSLSKCGILLNTVDDQQNEHEEISVPTTKPDVNRFVKSKEVLPEISNDLVTPDRFPLFQHRHKTVKSGATLFATDASNQTNDQIFTRDYPPTADGSLDYNLLHRLKLEASPSFAAVPPPEPSRKRGSRAFEKTQTANFDIPSLFNKYPLHECANIIQLLLDRRYAIPIMPDLLKNVGLLRVVRRTEKDPFLSDDMKLLRVAIVSYVNKQSSKTAFLLKDGFHVSSSLSKKHKDVFEVEVGQGFIPVEESNIPCIVLHVLGPFSGIWNEISGFVDYLIIEEPHSQNFDELDSIFAKYDNLTGLPKFVTVWIPSEEDPKYYEKTPFYILKGTLKEFIQEVSEDIARQCLKDEPTHQNCLTGLFSLPFNAEMQMFFKNIVTDLETLDSYRMQFLQLQKSFKRQGLYEARLRNFQEKNDQLQRNELEKGKVEEEKTRMEHAGQTEEELLIQLLLRCLSIESVEERILALRAMEDAISSNIMKSKKVEELNRDYFSLQAEYRDILIKGGDDPDVVSKRKEVSQINEQRNNAILSIDHVWRELSLLYCTRPAKFQHLPQKAAHCLLSGIPLELFDGDAQMLNLEWTDCVFESLQQMLPNKRIFVLSVLGEQSCGKSTLLNVMFGIRFRTSVGRCTNGLVMTLIKSENRTEYDYVLLLDTEGIRSPEHWGLPGCEKRDNQIASLAILPSDATILVVKGENDNALKDILPIVLMAYRGSLLAEKELGTLSSRFFVVYNQVMVTQEEKLESIMQSLSTSLVESFATVKNMKVGGIHLNVGTQFSVVSNTTNSDVCVLGCVNDGESPKDVPNFSFSKRVMSFREHIHQSIVKTPGWRPRQIINVSGDVCLVWKCLQSADFELSYLSLKERLNYCTLHEAIGKKEKDFYEKYRSRYDAILTEERKAVDNEEELKKTIEETNAHLRNLMSVHVTEFCADIKLLSDKEDYKKWQTEIDERKRKFLHTTREQFHQALDLSLKKKLYFENRLQDYQREMRKKIINLVNGQKMDTRDDSQFEMLFNEMLQKAEEENPPVNVKQKIFDVYRKSLIMNTLGADLISSAEDEKPQTNGLENRWTSAKGVFNFSKKNDDNLPKDKLRKSLSWAVYRKLEGVRYYSDTVVQDIIEEAHNIIKCDQTIQSNKDQNDRHSFVRNLLTEELEIVQAKWEESNSIHAGLKTKRDEMKQLYSDICAGLQNIDRLNSKLQYFFNEITSEAFRRELQEEIIRSVRKKHWYDSIHHLQGHLDLFLMEIEESYGIRTVLDWINNPSELRTITVQSLIEKEIKDTEVKWKDFKDRTLKCIITAFEESKKEEGCKAIKFINEGLPNLLGNAFLSNFFKEEFISHFRVAFDEFELRGTNHEFIQLRLKSVKEALHSSQVQINQKKLASEVLQILKELSPNEVCDLCEEHCKLCGGVCFKKRMHDGVRHDTYHQPGGLAGIYMIDSDILDGESCNTVSLDDAFTLDKGKTRHPYRDYSKVFKTWNQPDPDGKLSEYRQYLMHKYNNAIASYYNKKPARNIPPHYEKDFNQIREKIKRSVLYSQDYPSRWVPHSVITNKAISNGQMT